MSTSSPARLVPQDFWETEQKEGTSAFIEKRKPDYSRFRKAAPPRE